MTTYVLRNGKLVLKSEAAPLGSPQIMRDIEPYRAAAFDVAIGKRPVITSRREHKAFLKRNGYHEYTPIKQEASYEDVSPRELAREVERARHEVLSRRR